MSLRRLHSFAAAASGRFRRGHSTAVAHPPWAMIDTAIKFFPSLAQRVSVELAASPGVSHVVVPGHLVDFGPEPDPNSYLERVRMGYVGATSGDGLLLLNFMDLRDPMPVIPTHGDPPRQKSTGSTSNIHSDCESGATQERKRVDDFQELYITRTVCNPITGQLLHLPDIDGTKNTTHCRNFGLLTRSSHGHAAPDRYAVASLERDGNGDENNFVMRRFLSGTGEWEKFVVHFSSPLPLVRPLGIIELEVLAFAGRLWWIDPTWGTVSADPFSDRPELRFVELPRGRLLPGLSSAAEVSASLKAQVLVRRMGVSEGRLHYVEVSCDPPFKLSSFALGDDGCNWTLEHEVALGPQRAFDGGRHTPLIGPIDPLNASVVCLFVGDYLLAVDMDKGMVLGHSQLCESESEQRTFSNMYLHSCVLPPWLGSSRIPSAGKMEGAKKKTLADVLVRSG